MNVSSRCFAFLPLPLFYYAQFEKYLLFEIRARVFVHACGKASKDSGKIGWKSVALFLERASSVERRSPESSNESQSISRRVLVACSTSYNATVSDSYRFRHFRGMRTLSSRALNNSIRRSFLSLSECFNSKRRDLEPLIRRLIGTNRSRVSFHYTRTIIPYHSKMEFRDGEKIKKKIKRGRKNWKNYGLTTVKVTLALRRNVNRDRVVGRRRF